MKDRVKRLLQSIGRYKMADEARKNEFLHCLGVAQFSEEELNQAVYNKGTVIAYVRIFIYFIFVRLTRTIRPSTG